MQRKEEIVWGNGEGVEKSLKRMLEKVPPEKVPPDIEDSSEIKMKQIMEAMATKNDYMKENQFIEGFIQNNDKDLVNSRLSERRLFSDGIKNPFMVDADYSRDIDNASKYIKFGKK